MGLRWEQTRVNKFFLNKFKYVTVECSGEHESLHSHRCQPREELEKCQATQSCPGLAHSCLCNLATAAQFLLRGRASASSMKGVPWGSSLTLQVSA